MQAATESKLHHNSDTGQGGVRPPDAARSVLVLGTSAPAAKSLGNPEWVADLEYVWRRRTEPERERLEQRARSMRRVARDVMRLEVEYARQDILLPAMRVQALRSAEWAEERARAVAMERADVVATCDERWRSIACGCTRHDVRVGCDQPTLCATCRKRHAAKWWRRITAGMATALARELAAWHRTPSHRRRGMPPGIYLITLTAPHSGDMVSDRERIGKGVRKLLKHAAKYDWWRTYALTWEATGGDDGKGHVHVHLAVISSWVPYRRREVALDDADLERWDSESPNARPRPARLGKRQYTTERGLHDVWRDAVPGAIQPDVSPPNRARKQAESAAHYLAKYVTKGVDPIEFTGAKAGELLCAFRNRRKVSTSAGFWQDEPAKCACCGELYRQTEAPCSLQDIAPGAVLRSHVTRRLWLGVQEEFPPWMRREHHPPPLVVEARADKRNAPSRWVLPS